MTALTTTQIKVARLLASGVTQIEAAKACGISRATVYRYSQKKEFIKEVERMQQEEIALHNQKAIESQLTIFEDFYQNLQEYKQELLKVHRTQIGLGTNILKKIGDRFNDLPAESFTPKDLPGMLNIANNLLKTGFEGWTELLGVNEILQRIIEENAPKNSSKAGAESASK